MGDVESTKQGCCTGGGCDSEASTCGCGDDLVRARAQWERDFQAELARLQKRVADLEDQQRAHASRQICALMTEIESLERNVLQREVTTPQAKKKGLEVLGVDKKRG